MEIVPAGTGQNQRKIEEEIHLVERLGTGCNGFTDTGVRAGIHTADAPGNVRQ